MADLRFILNGTPVEVEGADPHRSVLHWLRERGLTGSKEGCAEGECGACAVALLRRDPEGRARYDAVNSCLLLLGSLADQEVVTVEGVGRPGALHPVQRAMVEQGGSQCGYCTPGFVVSMFSEYYRPGRAQFDLEAIAGNLCRCTGYRPIRDAARVLGRPAEDDPVVARLAGPVRLPARAEVRGGPKSRLFLRPTHLAELCEVLERHPSALVVAGGTDTVVDMNQRGDRHETIVAVDAVEELGVFRWNEDALEIGAAVPLREIEERLEGRLPLLEQLMPLFSSRLIRNRATLGGNLATASPIGDGPPVLLALDAEVRLASGAGERVVPLESFFTGYRATVLESGEVIVSVRIPRPFPAVQRFYKVSKRVLDDISTVAAAFAFDRDASGRSERVRLAYGGVAPTPIRVREAEVVLEGRAFDDDAVREASDVACRSVQPIDDHRGSAAYRRAMVGSLLEKLRTDLREGDA